MQDVHKVLGMERQLALNMRIFANSGILQIKATLNGVHGEYVEIRPFLA